MHDTNTAHTNLVRLSFLAGLTIGGIVVATTIVSASRLLSRHRRDPGRIISDPFAYRFDSARLVTVSNRAYARSAASVLVVEFSLENLSNGTPSKANAYMHLSASQDGHALHVGRTYTPIASQHSYTASMTPMSPHATERVFAVIHILNEMSPVYLAVHRGSEPESPAVSVITVYPQTVRLANNGSGISPLG